MPAPKVGKVAPAKAPAPKVPSGWRQSWDMFKQFLKDHKVVSSGLKGLSKIDALNQYKDYLLAGASGAEALGYGKRRRMSGGRLLHAIHQSGGSWSDFTNWVKGAANTVYNKALKPAWEYVKKKPVSTAGYILKGLSYIPSPLSGALSTAGTAVGAAGTAFGKGMKGGARKQEGSGKALMVF
jgi:hypothetical protein